MLRSPYVTLQAILTLSARILHAMLDLVVAAAGAGIVRALLDCLTYEPGANHPALACAPCRTSASAVVTLAVCALALRSSRYSLYHIRLMVALFLLVQFAPRVASLLALALGLRRRLPPFSLSPTRQVPGPSPLSDLALLGNACSN
jgi:hypothetical protein